MRPALKMGAVTEGWKFQAFGKAGVEEVAQFLALQAEGGGQGEGREIGGARGADVRVGGDQVLFRGAAGRVAQQQVRRQARGDFVRLPLLGQRLPARDGARMASGPAGR
jgi:hypothetical protein